MDQALANRLVMARRFDGLPAAGTGLPRLFALDRMLRMPGGYAYSIATGQVGFRRIDPSGAEQGKPHFPRALAPVALLEAGLIPLEEYCVVHKKAHANDSGCGAGSTAWCGAGDAGGGCGGD
ncbi:hypothetical protein [Massilia glaciei]|nr:hypothetical protein [Massilia glaciei]